MPFGKRAITALSYAEVKRRFSFVAKESLRATRTAVSGRELIKGSVL